MDQPIEKALKQAIKKARWKQWLLLAPISIFFLIIFCIVIVMFFYVFGNKLSTVQHKNLHQHLFLTHSIMQPNINIDSQVTRNGSMFGGTLVTNRSKDIDGYLVPWSTLESQYNWFTSKVDSNELIPGFFSYGGTPYEFDKQSKQKVATFYHPEITDYYDGVQNQLPQLVTLENHVAEVAISFKEPLTFAEIRNLVPDNLNIVWFYMLSRISNEKNGPSGLSIYGYEDENMSEERFNQFLDNLNTYHSAYIEPYMYKYIIENQNKPFHEVKVLGVLLTGRTENFTPLLNQNDIRGASVGVTVPIVPYIQPTK